jgi:hypothetical protein
MLQEKSSQNKKSCCKIKKEELTLFEKIKIVPKNAAAGFFMRARVNQPTIVITRKWES